MPPRSPDARQVQRRLAHADRPAAAPTPASTADTGSDSRDQRAAREPVDVPRLSSVPIGRPLCYDRPVTATRFRGGRIMGIRIPTVFSENDAKRCAGCGEPIEGTPFRVTMMDNVAREAAPSWAERAPLNPGRTSSTRTRSTSGTGLGAAATSSARSPRCGS